MEAYDIYLSIPDGFHPTGEYRPPKQNEYYLAIDSQGDWSAFTASRDHKDDSQIILKEMKRRGKKEKQVQLPIPAKSRKKAGK